MPHLFITILTCPLTLCSFQWAPRGRLQPASTGLFRTALEVIACPWTAHHFGDICALPALSKLLRSRNDLDFRCFLCSQRSGCHFYLFSFVCLVHFRVEKG